MNPQQVLRLCASYASLPAEQCAVPGRCETRVCSICGQGVHYDPLACIPALGPERIVCVECFELMPT